MFVWQGAFDASNVGTETWELLFAFSLVIVKAFGLPFHVCVGLSVGSHTQDSSARGWTMRTRVAAC